MSVPFHNKEIKTPTTVYSQPVAFQVQTAPSVSVKVDKSAEAGNVLVFGLCKYVFHGVGVNERERELERVKLR